MSESHRFGRQRLAWFILTGSFITCISLSILIPLGLNAFLQNADRSLEIAVQANQEQNGPRRAALFGEPPQTVGSGTSIRTDTTASALLTVMPPDRVEPYALLQVAGNSTVRIDRAETPRFDLSNNPNRMRIDLQAGRVRVDIPPFEDRVLEMTVTTPQGAVIAGAGTARRSGTSDPARRPFQPGARSHSERGF